MRPTFARRLGTLVAAGVASLLVLYAGSGSFAAGAADTSWTALAHQHPSPYRATQLLLGTSLDHSFVPAGSTVPQTEPLSDPDDITRLGDDLFVGFQNGVGPQGEASADGNLDSTVVELTLSGHAVAQWDIQGKTDGVTADPALGEVIATVNEDANSALYTIRPSATPGAGTVTSYAYSEVLPHGGGTDAISIDNGQILISASAPGTNGPPAPQPTDPAVYSVILDPATHVATVRALFDDEDSATIANVSSPQFLKTTTLALTDPDSNEVVPFGAPRFAGDFMLTSQGDMEQIYVAAGGSTNQRLSVLALTQAVDDTAWPTGPRGALYATDSTNDAVDMVTTPYFGNHPLVAATPCDANGSPATCPGPGYPANYLATLNPWTGKVTPVTVGGAPFVPQGGLAFVSFASRGTP
jgi:hypothetical protein